MRPTHDHRVESSEQVVAGRVIADRMEVGMSRGGTTSYRGIVELSAVEIAALGADACCS